MFFYQRRLLQYLWLKCIINLKTLHKVSTGWSEFLSWFFINFGASNGSVGGWQWIISEHRSVCADGWFAVGCPLLAWLESPKHTGVSCELSTKITQKIQIWIRSGIRPWDPDTVGACSMQHRPVAGADKINCMSIWGWILNSNDYTDISLRYSWFFLTAIFCAISRLRLSSLV